MRDQNERIDVHRKIIAERRRKGWTQSQLAKAAGMTQPMVAKYEGGAPPSLANKQKLARAFGISFEELTSDSVLVKSTVKHKKPQINDALEPSFQYMFDFICAYTHISKKEFARLFKLSNSAIDSFIVGTTLPPKKVIIRLQDVVTRVRKVRPLSAAVVDRYENGKYLDLLINITMCLPGHEMKKLFEIAKEVARKYPPKNFRWD